MAGDEVRGEEKAGEEVRGGKDMLGEQVKRN